MTKYAITMEDVVRAQSSGSSNDQMKVVEAMMPKVISSAKAVRSGDWDDLVQAGRLGTLEALQSFNPAKGVQFPAYAKQFIEGAVKLEAGKASGGPTVPHTFSSTIAKLYREDYSANEIVDYLEEKHGGNRLTYIAAVNAMSSDSLDQLEGWGGEDDVPDNYDNPEDDQASWGLAAKGDGAEEAVTRLDVYDALMELPERQRTIVAYAYGFDGGAPLTDAEIGRIMQLERSVVGKIRREALSSIEPKLSEEI